MCIQMNTMWMEAARPMVYMNPNNKEGNYTKRKKKFFRELGHYTERSEEVCTYTNKTSLRRTK